MSSVDVVVPSYNYAHYLPVCVRSVLEQTGVDVRVLIIDDCSTDDTPTVAQRLVAADPRVEYRRHATNLRHIATYNEGLLGWASADYCVLLSADDAIAPGSLKRAADLMDSHPEVGMVYGMAQIVGDAPELPAADDGRPELQVVPGPRFLQAVCEHGNQVPTPSAVVRTSLQRELGGYRPEYPHAGDLEMWMRFATRGSIGVLHNLQAYYRVHGNNMSSRYYAKLLYDRRERLAVCREIRQRCGDSIPEFDEWLQDLSRRLAREAFWISHASFDAGDESASRESIAFAEEVNPALKGSRDWWRLRLKRTLGVSLWARLRPIANRLRGSDGDAMSAWLKGPNLRHGTQFGWWPQT